MSSTSSTKTRTASCTSLLQIRGAQGHVRVRVCVRFCVRSACMCVRFGHAHQLTLATLLDQDLQLLDLCSQVQSAARRVRDGDMDRERETEGEGDGDGAGEGEGEGDEEVGTSRHNQQLLDLRF